MAAPALVRAESCADESAKARFSNTRALFEQLERCGGEQLPSFYSPRLQRSVTVPPKIPSLGELGRCSLPKDGPPPAVPPKPMLSSVTAGSNVSSVVFNKFQQSFASNSQQRPIPMLVPNGRPPNVSTATSVSAAPPGSPLSQVSRNFSQLASELDRITNSSRSSQEATTPNNGNCDEEFSPPPLFEDGGRYCSSNTFPKISASRSTTDKCGNGDKGTGNNFTPYWRDPSYYKKRCGVEASASKFRACWNEGDRADAKSENNTGSQPAEESARRDTSTSFVLVHRERNEINGQLDSSGRGVPSGDTSPNSPDFNNTPAVEAHPGYSTEREALNRKVSFSTAPIRVFKTHGIDEYDRRNEEIDPIASCAEYELERRLDKMDLFDVELMKGPEGLGVSIIGMGVGADSGLEKLGIFVKVGGKAFMAFMHGISCFGHLATNLKSITPGGAVHKDGRIRVCDQIVSVDGISLVGVSQLFAAQTLRATGANVTFTIGREASLEDSEVAQLIQQSLEHDRLKSQKGEAHSSHPNSTPQQQPQRAEPLPLNGGDSTGVGKFGRPPIGDWREPEEVATSGSVKDRDGEQLLNGSAKRTVSRWMPELSSNDGDEARIKLRIEVLERELNGQLNKAEQMQGILDNTRQHYSQLENKYDQARELLKNYQEREKEMLEREEVHVEQLREKDAQYSELIGHMRKRIEELELKLEQMAKRRVSVVEGELNELRERLAACAGARPAISQLSPPTSINGESYAASGVQHGSKGPTPPLHHSMANGNGPPRINPMHAGMTKRLPLSTAPPQTGTLTVTEYERMISNGVQIRSANGGIPNGTFPSNPTRAMENAGGRVPLSARSNSEAYAIADASGECSPVPRISEPASPALPPKFHQRHRVLFPIRRHYHIPAENEFWREDVEAQGLRVLSWDVDEVCQLLIHIGLDRYIPEFTVNSVSGPKFLELDGSKLKAMGICNHSHRSIIKKKVKAIRSRIEKERKLIEKESRERSIAKI